MADGEQVRADLRNSAYREASQFMLPENWQEDREPAEGMTIDSSGTQDRDDAIKFARRDDGGLDIRITAPDLATVLDPNSAIIGYAEQQAQTRYLSTSRIPMIPPTLSEGRLSLLETQETPSVTLSISYDNRGAVEAVEFAHTRIQPQKLTYGQVADILAGKGSEEDRAELEQYRSLAFDLMARRRSRGAFAFYDATQGLLTDEDGVVRRLKAGVEHPGEIIVQEFMVLANTAVGEYMWRNGIPGIFRNHDMRHVTTIDQAIAMIESGSPEQLAQLASNFGRAYYDTEPKGHAGLNLHAYAHWSSPLRRVDDYINHANIQAFREGRPFPYEGERLAALVAHLNEVQDEIRERKSISFADAAKARTARQLGKDALALIALDQDTFFKVAKLAVETGQLSSDLASAVQERAKQGLLRSRELARLLFHPAISNPEWEDVTNAALEALQANPADAISTIEEAKRLRAVMSASYAMSQLQEQLFACQAAIELADGRLLTAEAQANSKKAAQQLAAVRVLASAVGRVLPEPEAQPAPEIEMTSAPEPATGNPKGQLLEYFQARQVPLPEFEVEPLGPTPTEDGFKATVHLKLDGQERAFEGTGKTKKAAEAAAAADALAALPTRQQREAVPAPVAGNPVSMLQERAQAARLPMPSYQFSQTGESHIPTFTCIVTVTDAQGQERSFTATGGSKAEAKTNAARLALNF